MEMAFFVSLPDFRFQHDAITNIVVLRDVDTLVLILDQAAQYLGSF